MKIKLLTILGLMLTMFSCDRSAINDDPFVTNIIESIQDFEISSSKAQKSINRSMQFFEYVLEPDMGNEYQIKIVKQVKRINELTSEIIDQVDFLVEDFRDLNQSHEFSPRLSEVGSDSIFEKFNSEKQLSLKALIMDYKGIIDNELISMNSMSYVLDVYNLTHMGSKNNNLLITIHNLLRMKNEILKITNLVFKNQYEELGKPYFRFDVLNLALEMEKKSYKRGETINGKIYLVTGHSKNMRPEYTLNHGKVTSYENGAAVFKTKASGNNIIEAKLKIPSPLGGDTTFTVSKSYKLK